MSTEETQEGEGVRTGLWKGPIKLTLTKGKNEKGGGGDSEGGLGISEGDTCRANPG